MNNGIKTRIKTTHEMHALSDSHYGGPPKGYGEQE